MCSTVQHPRECPCEIRGALGAFRMRSGCESRMHSNSANALECECTRMRVHSGCAIAREARAPGAIAPRVTQYTICATSLCHSTGDRAAHTLCTEPSVRSYVHYAHVLVHLWLSV
jgi:hypothetical protein